MHQMHCYLRVAFLLVFVFVSSPFFASADAGTQAVNCFDYYRFGSIQVPIQGETQSVVPGQNLAISGKAINENPYPIVDGGVFVKVFRIQADDRIQFAQGGNLVDQFFALDGTSIDSNASREIRFNWKVPANAMPGEYEIAAFFVVSKKFNMLGLPFTDDVVGNRFRFKVNSDNLGVYFDKRSVKLNGYGHKFISFAPQFKANEDIRIESALVNTTDTNAEVVVKWKLYSWDQLREENLIYEKTENLRLGPFSESKLIHVVEDKSVPVGLLQAEVYYLDTKSILQIRFVREGQERPRINSLSFGDFPVGAGEKGEIFACIHSTGQAESIDGGSLEVRAFDGQGNEIAKIDYSGKITGDIMGFKSEFTPQARLAGGKMTAKLYLKGRLVDSAELLYDCAELNPAKCLAPKQPKQAEEIATKKDDTGLWLIGILATASVLALVFVLFKKFKGEITGAFLVLGVMSLVLLAMPGEAHAAKTGPGTITWQHVEPKDFFYWEVFIPTASEFWYKGLDSARFGVSYGAQVVNKENGQILKDGDTVPKGANLSFRFLPRENTDIDWSGVGYSYDSPYGIWAKGAMPPNKDQIECLNEYKIGKNNFVVNPETHAKRTIYAILSVDPPKVTFRQNGTAKLECKIISEDEQECEVKSGGTINPVFTFSETYGHLFYRFYYQQWLTTDGEPPDPEDYVKPCRGRNCPSINKGVDDEKPQLEPAMFGELDGCYGNNIPMSTTVNLRNVNLVDGKPYRLQVPEQKVEFNFTVKSGSNDMPPDAPQLNGPTKGYVGKEYGFSVKGSHPQNKKMRFGIDWDSDRVADQWVPETFVDNGVEVQFPKSWPSKGEKTIGAIAVDDAGLLSGWAKHDITLFDALSADAGPDIVEETGMPVFLNGSALGGVEPYVEWQWELLENGANCEISQGSNTPNARMECKSIGETEARLTVTDSDGVKASDYAKATIISEAKCSITGHSESGIGEGTHKFEVSFSGFKENPALNNENLLDCGGRQARMECTPAGNAPPFSGKCTASCAFSEEGEFKARASMKNWAGQLDCGERPVSVKQNQELPVVSISALDPTASEPDNDTGIVNDTGLFWIYRLGGDLTQPLEVNLLAGGSAEPGNDYEPIMEMVEMPAGSNYAAILVTPIGDYSIEGTETVSMGLVQASPGGRQYTIDESKKSAEIKILDNDAAKAGPECEILAAMIIDQDSREVSFGRVNYSNLSFAQSNGSAKLDFGDSSPAEDYANLPADLGVSHEYGDSQDSFAATLKLYSGAIEFARCTKSFTFAKKMQKSGPFSASITINTDHKYYKVDNVDTMLIDVTATRNTGNVGKVFYTLIATRAKDNSIEEIKSDEELEFDADGLAPKESSQKVPWKISKLPTGVWTLTARITKVLDYKGEDVTAIEGPKTDNVDSQTVLVYSVKNVEAPEISPIFLIAIAAGVLLILNKKH